MRQRASFFSADGAKIAHKTEVANMRPYASIPSELWFPNVAICCDHWAQVNWTALINLNFAAYAPAIEQMINSSKIENPQHRDWLVRIRSIAHAAQG